MGQGPVNTTSHVIEKLPGYRQRKFVSLGQIHRMWGLSPKSVEDMAESYGWATRRGISTGWHTQYRLDHVERTMQIIGATKLHG